MNERMNKMKEHLARVQTYKKLFASEEGQEVLKDLRKFCFVDASTMSRGNPGVPYDALDLALREGQRNVFLRIRAFLNTDESLLLKRMKMEDK